MAFCLKHSVKLSTFQYWLYRNRKQKSEAVNFLPIEVKRNEMAVNNSAPPIEIVYRDGTILRISNALTNGVAVRAIRELIPALRK